MDSGTTIMAVAITEGGQCLSLHSDRTVFVWPENEDEIFNTSDTGQKVKPYRVENLKNVRAIGTGLSHFLALDKDGKLFSWGESLLGQTGSNQFKALKYPVQVKLQNPITSLACGDNFSIVTDNKGFVFGFGLNDHGQLNGDLQSPIDKSPILIQGLPPITKVACSCQASLALDIHNRVWTWGYLFRSESDPIGPSLLDLPPIIDISAGVGHYMALTKTGEVFTWGSNSNGQLGLIYPGDTNNPELIARFKGFRSIKAGNRYSLARSFNGEVYFWGEGYSNFPKRQYNLNPKQVRLLFHPGSTRTIAQNKLELLIRLAIVEDMAL